MLFILKTPCFITLKWVLSSIVFTIKLLQATFSIVICYQLAIEFTGDIYFLTFKQCLWPFNLYRLDASANYTKYQRNVSQMLMRQRIYYVTIEINEFVISLPLRQYKYINHIQVYTTIYNHSSWVGEFSSYLAQFLEFIILLSWV